MPADAKTKELAILNYIEQNADATQRELSHEVGMSLGAINLLLKKLIKKGLVKVEKLQPNSVKYFLTPAGIANKVERTYNYIVRTYNEIDLLRNRIAGAVNYVADKHNTEQIIFFGPKDDFANMVGDLIVMKRFSADVQVQHKTTELQGEETTPSIFVWREESETLLKEQGYECINIMGMLVV